MSVGAVGDARTILESYGTDTFRCLDWCQVELSQPTVKDLSAVPSAPKYEVTLVGLSPESRCGNSNTRAGRKKNG